jgi:hypothetical protein
VKVTVTRFASAFLIICWSVASGGCAKTPLPTRAQLRELSEKPVELIPDGSPTPEYGLGSDATVNPLSRVGLTPTQVDPSIESPLPRRAEAPESSQPALRQLTYGGCCPNPFWSSDDQYVQFIDRPAGHPVGIYGVKIAQPDTLELITERIATVTGGGDFFVYPEGNNAVVQHAASGAIYVIPNGGRPISVSPDGQRLLWQTVEQSGDYDKRRGEIWVSQLDGSNPRMAGETVGFAWSEWIDAARILLVGVPYADQPLVGITALILGDSAADDQMVELARVARPRETLVSPDGRWLVYMLAFQEDPADDGIWIVPTDGSRPAWKMRFFGAFHWQDGDHLLYVPMEPGAESHAFWVYDVEANAYRRLTDPLQTTFKIANNDWSVSGDGRYVAFVNAQDHNLWVIELEP